MGYKWDIHGIQMGYKWDINGIRITLVKYLCMSTPQLYPIHSQCHLGLWSGSERLAAING